MNAYYLYLEEQQTGPFSIEQLREMCRTAQANKDTLYWEDGLTEWLPLSTLAQEIDEPPARPRRLAIQKVGQVPGVSLNAAGHVTQPESPHTRGLYIIVGIFFGFLGIHDFFVGRLKQGVWHLVFFLLTFWTIIGPVIQVVFLIAELCTVKTDGRERLLS